MYDQSIFIDLFSTGNGLSVKLSVNNNAFNAVQKKGFL